MAYVALYRKFRPARFSELVGQEHIVRTLSNQLESGRIAHAYLFAGPRGTGKTSTAKLFARAINCAHPVNSDPCGECDACKAFEADDNMDIIEIDAASNNGVDNIRDIRDKVVFAPAYGKYKVYIIDEVHMLSGGAFNALLKTLEEPPKHVVFILATTEIHKLPATILSRCQRFDFKLISSSVILDRLKHVLESVGAEFEESAIDLIAKSASGGMRDALSLADVCLSYCGSRVTLQDAINVLGVSDRSFVFDFADALIASNTTLALEKCRELEADGKDIGVFTLELMSHMRDLMLSVFAPESPEIKALPLEIQEKLKKQAEKANGDRILRSIEILSALESEIKLHLKPHIQLECAIARICMPQLENDISALNDRISVLEEKLKSGITVTQPTASTKAPWDEEKAVPVREEMPKREIPVREEPKRQEAPAQRTEAPKAMPKASASGIWAAVIAKLKATDPPFYLMFRNFDGMMDGDKFNIYVPEAIRQKEALVIKNADTLAKLLKEITGKDLKIVTVIGTKPKDEQAGGNANMNAALDLFS
jgi:DNA polymerase-3 subunit gamma/tau